MSRSQIPHEQNPSRRDLFKGLIENLEEDYDNMNLENQKFNKKIENLQEDYNRANLENQNLNKKIENLQEGYNRANLENQNLNKKIHILDKEIAEYKKTIRNLEAINLTYENERVRYQHEIEPKHHEAIKNMEIQYYTNIAIYKQEVDVFYGNIIAGLKAEAEKNRVSVEAIERLNKRLENSNLINHYTSGDDPLNYRLSEEDTDQLSNDMNSLNDKIKEYVTTLRGHIRVDNDKIQGLYEDYNLDTYNLNDKILTRAVLQRYVLENGLKFVNDYLEIKDDDDPNSSNNQEKYIVYYTNKLIDILDKFYNNHFKRHDITIDIISTKIRQQVYGILGEFGFSAIYENEDKNVHPFISSTALELNQLMVGYRYIEDKNERKTAENMAENLIKDIARIFKFRLLAQKPDDDYPNGYIRDICLPLKESDEVRIRPPPLPPRIEESPQTSFHDNSENHRLPYVSPTLNTGDLQSTNFGNGSARLSFKKKKSRVRRDIKTRKAVAMYEVLRQAYRYIIRNESFPMRARIQAQLELNDLPRETRSTTIKNRCTETGRGRAVFRDSRLCRYQFRLKALNGELPGVKKAIW